MIRGNSAIGQLGNWAVRIAALPNCLIAKSPDWQG